MILRQTNFFTITYHSIFLNIVIYLLSACSIINVLILVSGGHKSKSVLRASQTIKRDRCQLSDWDVRYWNLGGPYLDNLPNLYDTKYGLAAWDKCFCVLPNYYIRSKSWHRTKWRLDWNTLLMVSAINITQCKCLNGADCNFMSPETVHLHTCLWSVYLSYNGFISSRFSKYYLEVLNLITKNGVEMINKERDRLDVILTSSESKHPSGELKCRKKTNN